MARSQREKNKQLVAMLKRRAKPRRLRVVGCSYCTDLLERKITFAPPHDPAFGCESGKHPHCTCDVCF